MSTTTQRPTPETSRFMDSLHGYSDSWEQFAQKVEDFSSKLERERDEALAANFRDTSFSVDALPYAVKRVVRECDEVREELENILNVIPADAPCLHAETGETVADYILGMQKEVGRVHALYFNDKQQLEAMREALKEAHDALTDLDQCRIFYGDSMDIDSHVTDACATARAKLKPLLP